LYYTASGITTLKQVSGPIDGRPVHRLREDCSSSWLITKINVDQVNIIVIIFVLP